METVWILYHGEQLIDVFSSSEKVKEYMSKFNPEENLDSSNEYCLHYTSFDVYKMDVK